MAHATVVYTQSPCVNKQIKVYQRQWNPTLLSLVCSFLYLFLIYFFDFNIFILFIYLFVGFQDNLAVLELAL